MPLEDFFEKQVDELGKVLAQLLTGLTGFKDEGQFRKGRDMVENTLKAGSLLNFSELEAASPDEFFDFLNSKKVKADNFESLAELCFEMADGLEESEPEKAIGLYEKSLKLHLYLNENGAVYSFERHYKIDEIREILDHYKN